MLIYTSNRNIGLVFTFLSVFCWPSSFWRSLLPLLPFFLFLLQNLFVLCDFFLETFKLFHIFFELWTEVHNVGFDGGVDELSDFVVALHFLFLFLFFFVVQHVLGQTLLHDLLALQLYQFLLLIVIFFVSNWDFRINFVVDGGKLVKTHAFCFQVLQLASKLYFGLQHESPLVLYLRLTYVLQMHSLQLILEGKLLLLRKLWALQSFAPFKIKIEQIVIKFDILRPLHLL